MTLTVYVQLDGSSATYEVKHQVDGIYKAILLHKGNHISYHFPEKIILIRLGDGWMSDCSTKAIGLKIGERINEHERSS